MTTTDVCMARRRRRPRRQRGAAAILAMMFLVIFSSLAAAMAIVAQGNLTTADTHLKINRALAAAETGMRFLAHHFNVAAEKVMTSDGVIDAANAPDLWESLRDELFTEFSNHTHFLDSPGYGGYTTADGQLGLWLDRVAVSSHSAVPYFRADIRPRAGDPTIIDVQVTGYDGPADRPITRTIEMTFRLDKKIRFAILSKSRVMLGPNVMVEGPIGSRFMETDLLHGHPVQMAGNFRGLDSELDADLDAFIGTLITNDINGDNRINLRSPSEVDGITDPEQYDTNGDGFIDDFDFFMARFDTNADGTLTAVEFGAHDTIERRQLFELLAGSLDAEINGDTNYAKVKGQVLILADKAGWEDGAGQGPDGDNVYQDFFQGSIIPGFAESPLLFGANAQAADVHQYGPGDFDVSSYRTLAVNDLVTEAAAQAAQHDPDNPDSPGPLGETTFEEIPFGAAHPYDYYDRPVYRNMTFRDVVIPKGTNALFINCRFIGVTFIETETDNSHDMFNYAGMQNADGSYKHPDRSAVVDGTEYTDTKPLGNNIRFHDCTFEGSIVSSASTEYTHVRNKAVFTGRTMFDADSNELSDEEKALYRRSSILMPHYSIDMGTFVAPHDSNETVELTGTIVAGIIDIRGQADITGTILTTFNPQSNTGPVIGETSPQFNTTLGYFDSGTGDFEAALPMTGLGKIRLRYDPSLPLPDGITGPIELRADPQSYRETTEPVHLPVQTD